MSFAGFHKLTVPSPSPPATRPIAYSSEADSALLQERRLKRSALGQEPTTGSSCASDWKSSLKISRLEEELKERSTAPAIVPAARNGASGAKATSADRAALLMHAMRDRKGSRSGSGSRFVEFRSETCERASKWETKEHESMRYNIQFGPSVIVKWSFHHLIFFVRKKPLYYLF